MLELHSRGRCLECRCIYISAAAGRKQPYGEFSGCGGVGRALGECGAVASYGLYTVYSAGC